MAAGCLTVGHLPGSRVLLVYKCHQVGGLKAAGGPGRGQAAVVAEEEAVAVAAVKKLGVGVISSAGNLSRGKPHQPASGIRVGPLGIVAAVLRHQRKSARSFQGGHVIAESYHRQSGHLREGHRLGALRHEVKHATGLLPAGIFTRLADIGNGSGNIVSLDGIHLYLALKAVGGSSAHIQFGGHHLHLTGDWVGHCRLPGHRCQERVILQRRRQIAEGMLGGHRGLLSLTTGGGSASLDPQGHFQVPGQVSEVIHHRIALHLDGRHLTGLRRGVIVRIRVEGVGHDRKRLPQQKCHGKGTCHHSGQHAPMPKWGVCSSVFLCHNKALLPMLRGQVIMYKSSMYSIFY